jgi:GDPmannose 4,6-dehydratase
MNNAARRTLIVGSAGQDGSLLEESLRRRGDALTGITRSGIVVDGRRRPFDIADAAQVRELVSALRPDEIYYLAAYHHSSEETVPPDGALFRRSFEIHVTGLSGFLEAIRLKSPASRLFYAASSHVFGAAGPALRDETVPLNPDGIYGITKATGLMACRYYRDARGVFAAGGILFPHESSLRREVFLSKKIALGVARASRDKSARIVLGDLDSGADWGYAPDYVEAMQKILSLDAPEDFVVATGVCHTAREFAQIAFAAAGLDYRVHVQSSAALVKRRFPAYAGNSAKLTRCSGWKPSIGFEQMVRRLVEAELAMADAK